MATGQTIVNDALTRIDVLQEPGQTPQTEQSQYALDRLNLILDQWLTNGRYLYAITKHRYDIDANVQTYTLGPSGADWTGPRPVGPPPGNGIKNADYVWDDADPEVRTPIYIMNDDEWAAVRVPSANTGIVTGLYNANTYPNTTIYLYGMPTQANAIELFVPAQISQISTLGTTVTGPPGYLEAFTAVLAEQLCGAFNKPITESVRDGARRARVEIQRINNRTFYQPNDYGRIGSTRRAYGAYLWWPGQWWPSN